MSIEFRDLASQAQKGFFDFPMADPAFRVGFWNHLSSAETVCSEFDLSPAHYGFVWQGQGELFFNNLRFQIQTGMYFCLPGPFAVSGNLAGIVMSGTESNALVQPGIFQLGGPIEPEGRLKYIDGCSDTLLISPPKLGMPCVNLLHIPPNTLQRYHTHPSFRFGIITDGNGSCDSDNRSDPLRPGTVFYIQKNGNHRFRTDESRLSVIAMHPDSDFGPDDSNHPMVNRTMVNGVSASELSMADRMVEADKQEELKT